MIKRLDYSQAAPNGAKTLGGVYGYVMQSGLPAELVELLYLRVGSTRALRRSRPGRTWRARCAVRHGEHEKRIGQHDADWPNWYAAYIVAEQTGDLLPS
jgi:hypothetical protein